MLKDFINWLSTILVLKIPNFFAAWRLLVMFKDLKPNAYTCYVVSMINPINH